MYRSMNVNVKTIFAMEKYLGDRKEHTLIVPEDATLLTVLQTLVQSFGEPLNEKLFQGDQLQKGMILYVNGRNSLVLDHLQTLLKDGDEILIMPPVGGG